MASEPAPAQSRSTGAGFGATSGATSGAAFGADLGRPLSARLAILCALLLLAAWAATAGKPFSLLLAALAAAMSVAELLRFLRQRERRWQQVIVAWAAGERVAPPLVTDAAGARAIETVNEALFDRRAPLLARVQTLEALVDHSPAALFQVFGPATAGTAAGTACEPLNRAARRLLAAAAASGGPAAAQAALSAIAAAAWAGPGANAGQRMLRLGAPGQRFALATTALLSADGESRMVALQDVQDAFDQAQASAWRDLARVLSHEIMNSLAPIISLAESAARELRRGEATPASTAAIEALARRAQALSAFVQSYRAIANPLTPARQRIALQPWLTENLLAWRAQWGPALHWECSTEPAELSVWADPALLQQAVGALVVNAAQAALAAAPAPAAEHGAGTHAARVSISTWSQHDGWVSLAVQDSGAGIAPELRDHVFIPFFTTKHEGSGIGLSLARQIVLAHGGRIGIEDPAQPGTRIVLALPPPARAEATAVALGH